jgi:peptidyl-dipeptidase Dcp
MKPLFPMEVLMNLKMFPVQHAGCLVLILILAGLSLAGQAKKSPNPLLETWTTPFGVPPFEKIKTEHFLPAFESAIAAERGEVEAISNNPEAPTFANTLEALDAAGEPLSRVSGVFYSLTSAETSESLQDIARKVAPLTTALRDDILMNEKLFSRVNAVWDRRENLGLNPEQLRLVGETRKDFIRGGANLDPEKKKRMRAINERLAVLELQFNDNVLKETNAFKLVIDKKEDLAGLPEAPVNAAAEEARAAGLEGKWVFTLNYPSIWPFMTYADNRDLRRRLFTAYIRRGDNGNAQDNKGDLIQIAGLRAEAASLMGYTTHADFVLERCMAKTPDKVYDLLNRLWVPALAVAVRERADQQALIQKDGKDFRLEPWDWWYYSEKVKKARYDLDENEVRQYFKLENVVDGAFGVAGRLYGLRFIERKDLPKYNPEVRTFEVKDADGSHLGVFYADFHPRPSKRGGAWSGGFRDQYFKDGKDIRPIVTNVCNFTRPSGDTPALLSLEEVETLYHELGHGLHSLLSRIHYKSLGGVPRDFVELPSQIMEHWATEPEVLKTYARHWKTGALIPEDLVRRIKKADAFNQGFKTVEYLAASFLDMDWHTMAGVSVTDANLFEKASMEKIGLIPEIVTRYRSPYFRHIFEGGYDAGYYSYIWSEVLDCDAFEAFKEKGIFDPATALSFRKNILEKAGSEEAMEMYVKFRGREPSVEPLLEKRGLK